MPASPDEWTGGDVRPAKKLRRWDGAGAPPREYTIDRRRHAVVQMHDTAARYVPPDCDPTYGDEEPEIPLPVAESRREANRALVAICCLGVLLVVGLMLLGVG